jgi:hypothetical protein
LKIGTPLRTISIRPSTSEEEVEDVESTKTEVTEEILEIRSLEEVFL